jgi:tetratricopeptide (TPR) repeat protein
MEAKTPSDSLRKPADEKRSFEEPQANGKHALGDEAVGRLERAIQLLGDQQVEIVKALGALSARMPTTVNDPIVELARQVQLRPQDHKAYVALGNRLLVLKEYEKAEAAFRAAVHLAPDVPVARTSLAMALQKLRKFDEAIGCFLEALKLDPVCPARKYYTDLLFALKRFDEAIAFWKAEMKAAPHDIVAARNATAAHLRADRLEEAGVYARLTAERAWSTRHWPKALDDDPTLARANPQPVKAPKLRHDIEQLEYLVSLGIKTKEFPPIIEGLRRVLERVAPRGDLRGSALTQQERIDVGAFYNRIVHMVDAPEVKQSLSYAWDMAKIEEEYVARPPGIIHIDNLLSPEAMKVLRKFCIESTIWLSTNHDNGYLGAYISDGFCPPIMTQIARELRAAMPRVIGDRRLVGMWAYKYDQKMSGINTHADMAAVNVNFWITPDDANLDPTSGGLVVFDAEAPQEWDFELYNGNLPDAPQRIDEFLRTSNARRVEVPYKENRAVIFNSDLFHQTAPLNFKPGYQNRRVNVTLLYGDRTDGRLDTRDGISE